VHHTGAAAPAAIERVNGMALIDTCLAGEATPRAVL